MKKVLGIYFVILIIWWGYRSWFNLPLWVDELIIKPVVFVGIPIMVGYRLKDKIKLMTVLVGLGVGIGFGIVQVISRWLNIGHVVFNLQMVGSVALVGTAVAEELLFRGYIFGELQKKFKPVAAIVISAVMFAIIHVPIYGMAWGSLVLVMLSGVVYGVVRTYFGNVWPAVAVHLGEDVVLTNFY